jgi:hypothetical protein
MVGVSVAEGNGAPPMVKLERGADNANRPASGTTSFGTSGTLGGLSSNHTPTTPAPIINARMTSHRSVCVESVGRGLCIVRQAFGFDSSSMMSSTCE